MSKTLFLLGFTFVSSAFAASAPNAAGPNKEDPCVAGMMNLDHWAVQLEEDTKNTRSEGECKKEAELGKQSAPALTPDCAKLKFSELPKELQHLWLNHPHKGRSKPTPDVKLGSFSNSFRIETQLHVEESCSRSSAQ